MKKIILVFIVIALVIVLWIVFNSSDNESTETSFSEEPKVSQEPDFISNIETWKEFISTDYNFKILFPTEPNFTELGINLGVYTSKYNNKNLYQVLIGIYAEGIDVSKSRERFEASLDGMLEAAEGTVLISKKFTTFNQYPAMDYVIKHDVYPQYRKGKLIIAGHTLYNPSVDYIEGNLNEASYDKFINSFQILGND